MSQEPLDFLIIGQGLAGSILAWMLRRRGQTLRIVDHGDPLSASRIAAGIVNPVAGRRLVKYPNAENFLERARAFYAKIGNHFQQVFYFERPMIRLFTSEKERRLWEQRRANPAYRRYLGPGFDARAECPVPANRFGGFFQQECGFLETRSFLDRLRKDFESQGELDAKQFSWNWLAPKHGPMRWDGRRVRQIIGCEGHHAARNPYFSWLPFQLSKGEIVSLKSARKLSKTIINQGKWLLPTEQYRLKCGATYQWEPLDCEPSESARSSLTSSARQLSIPDSGLELIAHEAGIRPGSLDKMPFAGKHPLYPQIALFNGFGSRGVLTIPYYAERFVDHLLNQADLPAEIDLRRYLSLSAHATRRTGP